MSSDAPAVSRAQQVQEPWSAYGRGRNRWVPITFACDEQVWLRVSGHSFRRFYTDPRVHLHSQLEGRKWFAEQVPGDQAGLPERWPVAVQLWAARPLSGHGFPLPAHAPGPRAHLLPGRADASTPYQPALEKGRY